MGTIQMSREQFETDKALLETVAKLGDLLRPPYYVVLQVYTPEGGQSHVGAVGGDSDEVRSVMVAALAHIAATNAAQLRRDFGENCDLSTVAEELLVAAAKIVGELVIEQERCGVAYEGQDEEEKKKWLKE